MFHSYCSVHGEQSPHSQGECVLCRHKREENRLIEMFKEWSKDKTNDEMIFDLFCQVKKLENKTSFSDIIG